MRSESEAGNMFGDIPVLAPCVVFFVSSAVSVAFLRLLVSLLLPFPSKATERWEAGKGREEGADG